MFNPHIHQQQQQQQQQQQFHQHLRQLQQLFQQQPPPPPPAQPPPAHHVGHHQQTPRTIPVPTQTAPSHRMVNMCQMTQTTVIAPNPMLQSAMLMQQMQGNMRNFGMGGQQFRQFFTAGARSSLLGPVPMGMAIKSPIMGFPAARQFHPHSRFFNASPSSSSSSSTTDARQTDRKRDSEQMAAGSANNQPAAANSADEATDETPTDGAVEGENSQISEEQLEEPVTKRQKTEGSEQPKEQHVDETGTTAQSESNSNTLSTQSEGCIREEDGGFRTVPDVVMVDTKANNADGGLSAQSPFGGQSEDTDQVNLPAEEAAAQDEDAAIVFPESQDEDEASEGSNKFYCYLCSITCHNQQNFRSHMNSISHQQRMMEIQHMSNACLVTLLPRVQESLQSVSKDGERKADPKQWCDTCHIHFTCSVVDHQRSEEHKLACKTDLTFCAVCQKRFKTSQNFLEHMHSQEHKQKIQEKGCETLAKLNTLGTDGFSFEVEAQELQKNEGDQRRTQGGWSSDKEVTLDDMTSDKQYDPDVVYGTSFLDPVAGFICRLCKKFYLLESSAVHGHCKSLQHFENLKSYKAMVDEKAEDARPSTESIPAADGLRPVTETSDCSQEKLLTTDTSEATELNSTVPIVSATKLKAPAENQEESEASSILQDCNQEVSPDHEERRDASQVSETEESRVELAAGSREQGDSEPAAAAEDSNGEEDEEEEAPAGPGKKNYGGKGKNKAKRRSGRAANRR